MPGDLHTFGMAIALKEAEAALQRDEVPVGAAILRGREVVSRGHNLTRTLPDPTAHAEMVAIRRAAESLDHWWLEGCTLYVTLEPCAMCAGAAVLARLEAVVFGAADPKAGACGSLRNVIEDGRLNHRPTLFRGVSEAPCSRILRTFFRERREPVDR